MTSLFKKFWKREYRIEKKLSLEQLSSVRDDIKRLQDKGRVSSIIINYLMRNYPQDLGEQWEAERAYWTEVKRMEMTMIRNDSKELGIERFRVMPNVNACIDCLKLSEHGTRIFTAQEINRGGKPIIPHHPNCYCLILPVVD